MLQVSFLDVKHPNGYSLSIQGTSETSTWPNGNFTAVGFKMQVNRHFSFYLFNYYLPTGLFVVISWAAFAIPSTGEGLLGRIALLVTLFLVVTNIFNAAKSNLPRADEPNYIEIWIMFCLLFLLGTFVQTTVIFVILRLRVLGGLVKLGQVYPMGEKNELSWRVMSDFERLASEEHKVKIIDSLSCVISVIAFLMFNLWFWIVEIL